METREAHTYMTYNVSARYVLPVVCGRGKRKQKNPMVKSHKVGRGEREPWQSESLLTFLRIYKRNASHSYMLRKGFVQSCAHVRSKSVRVFLTE